VRLVDNVEANRLQLFLPSIPSEEIHRELKRNGFHWSRLPKLGNGTGATAQPTSPN
jgi:hypothetical protein